MAVAYTDSYSNTKFWPYSLEIYREIADGNAPSEAIYLHCACGNGNRPIRLDQIFLLVDF